MTMSKEILEELLKGCERPEDLLGDAGLMKELKIRLMERMLGAELTAHLGYEDDGQAPPNQSNRRNGAAIKRLKGQDGVVPIAIPRDRDGSFEPELVKKGRTRVDGMDDKIIGLYAAGLTVRDIRAHLEKVYGAPLKIALTLALRYRDLVNRHIGDAAMTQMGFFDLSDRYASLDAKKDPLVEIDAAVPWEEFRPALERVWRKPDADRKSRAGRKPMDAVVMFKALVLSALYNLSDDQIEYQVRDRLSFMRFLGLGLGDRVPDAKTVWLYRDALAHAGKVEELFGLFDGHLARQGYIARGGQILDACIVPVPRNHNTREENATIKKGEVPEDWADKLAKRVQKDMDARWTKKHGKSHYGYKNHVNVDRKHKLVRRYHVSDAAQHDSQAVDYLLMRGNTGSGVWADSAYRSEEMEVKLRARNLKSHIHRKGKRGKPLTAQAKGSNRTKSTVRVRVEHVFGAQANDMGGTLVRTIGLVRAKAKIGLKNLAYNMRRLCQLRRINPNPA